MSGPGKRAGFADVAALHDALDSLTLAALAAEGGDRERAGWMLLEASTAAADAFPAGSCEAEALGVIFGVIDRAAGTPHVRVPEPELGD